MKLKARRLCLTADFFGKVTFQSLEEMMEGTEVGVVAVMQELTTPEAARPLKASRQFLAKMVNNGNIRGRKVGKHRRVFLRDVLRWAQPWYSP